MFIAIVILMLVGYALICTEHFTSILDDNDVFSFNCFVWNIQFHGDSTGGLCSLIACCLDEVHENRNRNPLCKLAGEEHRAF